MIVWIVIATIVLVIAIILLITCGTTYESASGVTAFCIGLLFMIAGLVIIYRIGYGNPMSSEDFLRTDHAYIYISNSSGASYSQQDLLVVRDAGNYNPKFLKKSKSMPEDVEEGDIIFWTGVVWKHADK